MKPNEKRCRICVKPELVLQVQSKLEANKLNVKFFTAFMNTTNDWSWRFLSGAIKRTKKDFYERLMLFLESENVRDVPLLEVQSKSKETSVGIMPTNFKPYTQQIMPRIWAEQSNLVSKYLGRKNTN